jgi:hypothetical protein
MSQSNSIRNGLVIVFAFVVAIWLGITVVTDQTETILQIAVAILLLTCVFLGRRIWLLLILFTALNVPLLRGFGTTELGQALFVGFTVLMTLMRRHPFKFRFGEKEFWVFLLAACVLQAYFRNPVGLSLFGAGNVGAKPYFVVLMSFLSSLILGSIIVKPQEIRWAFWIGIFGSIVGLGLTALRMGGGGPQAFEQGKALDDGKGAGRSGYLNDAAIIAGRTAVSFISPLRALLHPFWAGVILFSVAAATMSGYRNSVAMVGLIMLVGLAYRGGFASVFISVVSGALLLCVIAFVNLVSPLPSNVQRALSPFPGTWEKRHVQAADESTEWRVDMWKEALFTKYWIKDKILGDGLGFSRRELLLLESARDGAVGLGIGQGSGMTLQQEAMMISGGYHSGPVQTIRTVGYVGLAVLLIAMIRIAVHAHRQIIRCRGTEWYPIALFIGVPAIILPIFFFFIFGEFSKDVAALLLSYGMVSLLEKNLPIPPYVIRRREPYRLNTRNNQAAA